MNLAALLDDVAKRRGNAPAVTYEGATLGYSAFNGRVAALAHSLRKQVGLAEGDRVGLAIDNSAAFLIALFAIWRAGLVAVPINAKLHGREVAQILENCSASLCLASPFLCEALNAAGSDCPLIDV